MSEPIRISRATTKKPKPKDSKLNDDQIWKIAAYVKGLRGTAIDAPSPGDVAAGVNGYRSVFEFLLEERRMP